MGRNTASKYRKVDEMLMRMAVSFFVILIMSQWYLRVDNKGIEPFLNKLYNKEGVSIEIIDIIPKPNRIP